MTKMDKGNNKGTSLEELIRTVKRVIKKTHSNFSGLGKSEFPAITIKGIEQNSKLARKNIIKAILALHERKEVEFDGDEKVFLNPKFYD